MAYRLLNSARNLENLVWKTFKQCSTNIPRVSFVCSRSSFFSATTLLKAHLTPNY